jgi:acetyl esterase
MLDPQTQALIARLGTTPFPRLWEMTPREWRAATDALFSATGLPPADLVDRRDLRIDGPHGPIGLRAYRPRDAMAGALPGLVYLHGGGMVTSTVDTYDSLVQHLCHLSGCVIVSVEYRLAPEHKFPVPFDDAYAATAWVHDNAAAVGIDPARLAVGGDSAGGLLAATVTHLARDRGGPPLAFQLLVYPAVGTRGHSASMAEFATGYVFERDELDWAYTQLLNDPVEARDPRVCPIAAHDFSRLPPAFVLCAEYEIMRDDIEHYGRLLQEAGVPVEVRRWPGQVHPFLNFAGVVDAGREAIADCAARLREALAAPASADRAPLGPAPKSPCL